MTGENHNSEAGARLVRGSAHVETQQGRKTLAMSLEMGKYFAISGTAQRIWEHLETPRTEAELVDLLCAEFEVPRERCEADLTAFIDELKRYRLVVETSQ